MNKIVDVKRHLAPDYLSPMVTVDKLSAADHTPFVGKIKNTVDGKGQHTGSVRSANFKSNGTCNVPSTVIDGYATVTVANAEEPVSVCGGDIATSVTRQADFATSYQVGDLVSSSERVSIKRSAKGKLDVMNSADVGIFGVIPSAYDVEGPKELGENLTDKLSFSAKLMVNSVKDSSISFAEVNTDNVVITNSLQGGVFGVTGTVDAVPETKKGKSGSAISKTYDSKSTSKLKATDTTFEWIVAGFGNVTLSGGSAAKGISGGNQVTTVDFKSSDDALGVELETPSDEQVAGLDAIEYGMYAWRPEQPFAGDHCIANSVKNTTKATGSIDVADGAVVGSLDEEIGEIVGGISGYAKVNLNQSTVGSVNGANVTDSTSSTSTRKGDSYKNVLTTSSKYSVGGSITSVDAEVGSIFGYKDVKVMYGTASVGGRICDIIESTTLSISTDYEVEEKKDKSTTKSNGVITTDFVGKVSVETTGENKAMLNTIRAKDITIKGDIDLLGLESGKDYQSNSTEITTGIGSTTSSTNTKVTMKSTGKLSYDGFGELNGDISGFSKMTLDGASFIGNCSSADYSSDSKQSTKIDVKEQKSKTEKTTTSTSTTNKSNATLTMSDCTFVIDEESTVTKLTGFKSVSLSNVKKADHVEAGLVGGVNSWSNKGTQTLTSVYDASLEDEKWTSSSVSGSSTVTSSASAAGSAKIVDSDLNYVSGFKKVEMTGSTIGLVSCPIELGVNPSKLTSTTTVKTDNTGLVTLTSKSTETVAKGGTLKFSGSTAGNISGFDNVTLSGGGLVTQSISRRIDGYDKATAVSTRAWANAADYIGEETAIYSETKTNYSTTSSGKFTGSVDVLGGIYGYANVNISGTEDKAVYVGAISAGADTTEGKIMESGGTTSVNAISTSKVLGTLKLTKAVVGNDGRGLVSQFKTVNVSGSYVNGNIISMDLVTTVSGEESTNVYKHAGTLNMSSVQDKGSSVVWGSQAVCVAGFDTVNLKGKDIYIGVIGNVFGNTAVGISKLNVKGIAKVDLLTLDSNSSIADHTEVNISGKGSALTLEDLVAFENKLRLNIGSGAMFKADVAKMMQQEVPPRVDVIDSKSKIAGELCINLCPLPGPDVQVTTPEVKLTGKITTSDIASYKALSMTPEADKVFFIGAGEAIFNAYMGETLEHADDDIRKAAELTTNPNGELQIAGWLNGVKELDMGEELGTFNCITDELDCYKFKGGAFDGLMFSDNVDVVCSSDGKNFKNWNEIEDKKSFLAGDGYLMISLKEPLSGPAAYSISNNLK